MSWSNKIFYCDSLIQSFVNIHIIITFKWPFNIRFNYAKLHMVIL